MNPTACAALSNQMCLVVVRTLRTAIVGLCLTTDAAADPLPGLTLDPDATTVSGLSSGAFMAVQLQIAFSGAIAGAGIVAGGPYDCAQGSVWRALYVCMDPVFVRASSGRSLDTMQELASDNHIDPLDGIAFDRVYLFHGKSDDTVDRSSMDALHQTYLSLGVNPEVISYVTSVDAGHGFVTEQGQLSCAVTRPDFLIDCDFDQAGDILNRLYDGLASPTAPADTGFLSFDQAAYTMAAQGMDDTGFVYVPADCAAGATCRLHIALHGCQQGRTYIGQDYARLTGYNHWAEANRIVVLYPQAIRIPPPWYNWFAGNPNGCWDWWGYAGNDYLSRDAPQLAAIARMAAALGAPLAQ